MRWIYETDGPGGVFHMDGNDKSKRWGLSIHGCVECFSRKISYSRVATNNNDPIIIANYYLAYISRRKFCCRVLRMDRGNQNIYCENLQVFSQETQKVLICSICEKSENRSILVKIEEV